MTLATRERAILALEDGTVFEGTSIGAGGRALGEVVFSTSMTGYQEMTTDPSYRGQILTLTYPLIGNYGTNDEDFEANQPHVRGLVVKELCEAPSNFRSQATAEDYLCRWSVVAIAGVDTRALTRKLRGFGVMMGGISTQDSPDELLAHVRQAPDYGRMDFVREVTVASPYQWGADWQPGASQATMAFEDLPRVVMLDLGVRRNVLRSLLRLGCEVMVLPATATADEVMTLKPDAVVVSPGPGNPEMATYAIEATRDLMTRVPLLGVCLGHQILALAAGGKTFKLKFGHRGANHPVKDEATGQVFITAQNHGFAVDADSLAGTGLSVTQTNLNDGTVEAMQHENLPVWSVQYHPEATPGPLDSQAVFTRLVDQIRERT